MPERTRVLWLTKGLALGGQERLLEFLARAHDDQTFAIECAYVVPGLDHEVPPIEAAGVPCTCLGTEGRPWAWIVALWRLLGDDRFDVVHVHSPLVAAVVRPLTRLRRRRPAVITTDHLEWSGYHPLTRWANRVTAPLDDAAIAVSPAVKRSMTGRAGARAIVMVQGIEVEELRRRHPRPTTGSSGETMITTVANFRAQKDYRTLIEAAALVARGRPSIRFTFVGDDRGDYGDEMHLLAGSLGVADRICFAGVRDDAVALIAAADIFVVASAHEAGPITAMEAAALGLPIASTAVGIMVDVFGDGENCLRVPVGEPVPLAEALTRLIDDEGLRRTLGQQAQRLADDQFDITRVIIELQGLYAEQAARRPVG